MNSRRPSLATATNGREPFASTWAGSTQATGRPADRSAAAIPSGPIRRSGTPNATSTPAPTVTPTANASISSAGRTVPVISRATAAAPSVIHAARRQGRLSHGAAATLTAAAAASREGPGERRAGQQRAVPGSGRYRVRVLVAGQVQDARERARRPRQRLLPGRPAGGTGGAAGPRPRPRRPRRRRPPAAQRRAGVRPGQRRARSRQARRDGAAGQGPPRLLRASRPAPDR